MSRNKKIVIEVKPDGVGAQTPAPPPPGQILTAVPVPVDLIDPNPKQPRKHFDQAALEELAGSIKEHGLIQPVIVEPAGDRFILHDGERRLRAAKLAGLAEIPAAVVPAGTEPRDLLIRAIVANDQRVDLSPIERAKSYQELADLGLSDEAIAKQVGKSRSVVANTRRLLNLPEQRQQEVAAGQLNERQALALLPLYQLPEAVQGKVLAAWAAKGLETPHRLTSDQIRDKFRDGLTHTTYELEFEADQELGGPGVRHSKCTDCPFYIRVKNQEMRCSDRDCLNAKKMVGQRRVLEEAKQLTGRDFIHPARLLHHGQYTTFYGSEKAIADHAVATSCPHLFLKYEDYHSNAYARPDGVPDHVVYACLHPGKSNQSCICRQAIDKEANDQKKAQLSEINRIKGQAIARLAQAIQTNDLAGLKAIAKRIVSSGSEEKVLALTDLEALAKKIAAAIIEREIYTPYDNDAAKYEQSTVSYLQKIGLAERSNVEELAARFQRIVGWITRLHEELPTVEAIRGNLTNLAKLAAEAGELSEQDRADFTAAHDAMKIRLLTLLASVEAERAEIDIEHVSWLLTVPPGDGNFKSHLQDANAPTLRYVLALVPGEDGHKVRIEALQGRLARLQKQEQEISAIRDRLKKFQHWAEQTAETYTLTQVINRGMALDDLAYDLNDLIRRYGLTDQLAALETDIQQTSRRIEEIRLAKRTPEISS